MTQVLVVCKTKMDRSLCLGGLTLDELEKIRLLTPDGYNQPATTRLEVGDIWECRLDPKPALSPPHTEDVRVLRQQPVRRLSNPKAFLLDKLPHVPSRWTELFEGRLRASPSSGTTYVSEEKGLPGYAHEFWRPQLSLRRQIDRARDKVYYAVEGARKPRRMSYTGVAEAPDLIPPGSLLHLSLARPWTPRDGKIEPRCYLLLSAVYI